MSVYILEHNSTEIFSIFENLLINNTNILSFYISTYPNMGSKKERKNGIANLLSSHNYSLE